MQLSSQRQPLSTSVYSQHKILRDTWISIAHLGRTVIYNSLYYSKFSSLLKDLRNEHYFERFKMLFFENILRKNDHIVEFLGPLALSFKGQWLSC